MHAFVSSVQLMEAANELLPLFADGQPALPAHTLAGQQAEVQAMLLTATAVFTAAEHMEWEGQQQGRLWRYLVRRLSLANTCGWDAAYLPALQPLAGRLLLCLPISITGNLMHARTAAAGESSSAAQGTRAVLDRQLAAALRRAHRSTSAPLLTAVQLEAAFWLQMAMVGVEELFAAGRARAQNSQPAVSGRNIASVAACAVMTHASSERMAALQPSNPKVLMNAGTAVAAASQFVDSTAVAEQRPSGFQLAQRALQLHLQAFRAAQAQHSAYWAVSISSAVLAQLSMAGVTICDADLAAVMAAAEEAPTVLRQLQGLLPNSWVVLFQKRTGLGTALLPAARASSSPSDDLTAAVQTFVANQRQLAGQEDRSCTCSGCGKRAMGLRRCARCKKAACERGGLRCSAIMWDVLLGCGRVWCSLNCSLCTGVQAVR